MSLAYKVEGSGSAFEQKDVTQTKYRQITYNVTPAVSEPQVDPVVETPRSYRENNRFALAREGRERAERPALAIPPQPQAPPAVQAQPPAAAPAPEPPKPAPSPEAAAPPPAPPADRSDVISVAMSQQGKPYRYGAEGPNSFDCSGFVKYCYGQVGVALPHNSGAQSGVGTPVSREALQPGDLVFFGSGRIHHSGIYVGNGNFIHSPSSGETVRVQSLSSHPGYAGARRIR